VSACPLTAAYEQLRSHVLGRPSPGGQLGLAVLLREGMASWIERCGAHREPHDAPALAATQASTWNALDGGSTVGLVNVLANLIEPALAGGVT
jgi:hypothetical protein